MWSFVTVPRLFSFRAWLNSGPVIKGFPNCGYASIRQSMLFDTLEHERQIVPVTKVREIALAPELESIGQWAVPHQSIQNFGGVFRLLWCYCLFSISGKRNSYIRVYTLSSSWKESIFNNRGISDGPYIFIRCTIFSEYTQAFICHDTGYAVEEMSYSRS